MKKIWLIELILFVFILSLHDYFVSVETLLMPKMQKKLLEKK